LFSGNCDGIMIEILQRHFAVRTVHMDRSSLFWYISLYTMRSSEYVNIHVNGSEGVSMFDVARKLMLAGQP
jgi:hypothetical protein